MDRPNREVHVSSLIDSSQCLRVPVDESVSMSHSFWLAAEGYGGDEETAIGYESSWSGIFPTCGQ